MAKLYPPKLSSSVRRKSWAEAQVYDKLAEVLDDNYHVFHSVRWSDIYDRRRESDGECDFIIAHPVHGMLAIEVKGGVKITSNSDVWLSKDHGGKRHEIKNPVEQAMRAKHQIKKLLDKSKEWSKQNIHMAHGVIFPSVPTPEESLGLEYPAELFCCSEQLNSGLDCWVKKRLRVGKKERNFKQLGDNGIKALKKIFGGSIRLNSNIRIAIEEARTEFARLESRQFEILDTIHEIPRALIKGGAGTGKTVLAMEEAKRTADKGLKTLYMCYNRPLEIDTRRKLGNRKNLTIKTFHSLCGYLVEKFNYTMPRHKSKKELFDGLLPTALFDIMSENSDRRYDAIIVDEGQDFMDHWWTAVLASLTDEGKLRVFADNNQNVYGGVSPKLKENTEATAIPLKQNFRNTKAIHRIAALHYEGEEIKAHGPDGMEVSWMKADSPRARIKKCIEKLIDLLDKDKVAQRDIAVLFNQAETINLFKKQIEEQKNGIRITDAENLTEDSVVVDTVKRFKGLDHMAVIWLVEGSDRLSRELAYVGLSRARAYLCVISSKKDHKRLKGEITHQSKQPSIPFTTNALSSAPVYTPKPIPPSTPAPSPTPISSPKPSPSAPPAPSPTPISAPKPVPPSTPAPSPTPISSPKPSPSATPAPSPTPISVPKPVSPSTPAPSPTPISVPKPVSPSTPAPSPTPISAAKPVPPPIKVPANNSTKKTVEKNWIVEAKHKATGCNTLEELKSAFEAFEGSMLREIKRKIVVFEGAIGADFIVIGEYHDDVSPFDGSAGELLDKMLASVNRSRAKNTLITHLNYWRPPNDQKPHADELAICRPFVDRMFTLTRPKLILSVGAIALKSILLTSESVSQLRGRLFNLRINDTASFKVFPTFHPGYLLQHPQEKSKAWRDLLKVEELLNSD